MTFQQIANLLSISERTARKEWAFARDWMRIRLSDDEALFSTHTESD